MTSQTLELIIAQSQQIDIVLHQPTPQELEKIIPFFVVDGSGIVQSVNDETPAGLLNGSNDNFSSAFGFVSESLQVLVNGLQQTRVRDFLVTGNNTFELQFAPISGETLRISYTKQL